MIWAPLAAEESYVVTTVRVVMQAELPDETLVTEVRRWVTTSVPPFLALSGAHATEVTKLLVWAVYVFEDVVEAMGVVVTPAEFPVELRMPLPMLLLLETPSAGLA